MKYFIVMTAFFVFALPSLSDAGSVRGHWRDTNRDGIKDTYVQPHTRTNPDSSRMNNYSYPGNYNPNSGTINPYSNSQRETYPSNPSPYNRGTHLRNGLED